MYKEIYEIDKKIKKTVCVGIVGGIVRTEWRKRAWSYWVISYQDSKVGKFRY